METWVWIANNSYNFLGAIGVVGSLWIALRTLRADAKTRRIANLLAITANHRELWKLYFLNKELARVRHGSVDIVRQPVTEAERVFVSMIIHHMSSAYYAMNDQLVIKMEGLRRDIAQFFSLPIPREVWERIKVLQNDDFIEFVESCRNWK